jgi:hypothetical protein
VATFCVEACPQTNGQILINMLGNKHIGQDDGHCALFIQSNVVMGKESALVCGICSLEHRPEVDCAPKMSKASFTRQLHATVNVVN